ncbi:MAG: hypothetical protein ABSG41_22210 [Bryobacteraceae bacterium]|jgi:hypothetical protein
MTEGFASIITQLERQKTAIEHALVALRGIEENPASVPAPSAPAARKGGMTPAGRRRLSAALKKRWAAKKAAESAPAATPAKAAPRKVRITPEGRKRLAEAMKRRWAVKRAASTVKKTVRKQRAAKKAA